MHELHDAYILHTYRFSDSKLITEFFTRARGRLKAVARAPSKKNRAQFQPFQPLTISVRGDGSLKTLLQCETLADRRHCQSLRGVSLFCAMYVNELTQRITALDEPEPMLFDIYESTLEKLSTAAGDADREAALRGFELQLLAELGYAIDFFATDSGEPLAASQFYRFDAAAGFSETAVRSEAEAYDGATILAIGRGEFIHAQTLRVAKKITRAALAPHLGPRPIKSRELFR